MKSTILTLISITIISCSSGIKNLWTKNPGDTELRNKKLITEDFKVGKEVLDKFSENKTKKKINKNVNPRKSIRVRPPIKKIIKKSRKKSKSRVRTLPIVLTVPIKVVTPVQNTYPDDYPEKLMGHDLKSEKFWNDFSPYLFEGEVTTLDVTYMGISTGKIIISTQADTIIGDSDAYHLSARLKTSSYYSYLYEVDDICDSYVEKTNFIPLKFSLIQRQSSQNIDDLQLFDLNKLKTYTFYKRVTKTKNKKKKSVKSIPRFFQDPLSVLYFVRGLPFKDKTVYRIPIVNQGKIEFLEANLEKKEILKTDIGKIEAYKINILSSSKGKTIKGGNMTFWFSADSKRRFLRFVAKIKIGSISGEISSYKE